MFENKLIGLSSDNSLFCICNKESILKFWDTTSNSLEYEFHPGENLSSKITCLSFSPQVREKGSNSNSDQNPSEIQVVLGTVEGTVLIYNVNHQKVSHTFKHKSGTTVWDVCWHTPHQVASIGGGKLIVRSLDNVKMCVLNTIEGRSLCSPIPNTFIVANTNIQVLFYTPTSKKSSEVSFPGHKTTVTSLLPVKLVQNSKENFFISVAEDDRFLYLWSTGCAEGKPLESFMVQEIVKSVSVFPMKKSKLAIAVTTKNGRLRYLTYKYTGKRNSKPVPFDGGLVIASSAKSSKSIPILGASFESSKELLVVYGSQVFPHCERISCETLLNEVNWSRKDPSEFKKTKKESLVKTVTPVVSDATVHLLPAQMKPQDLKLVSGKRKKGGDLNLPMEQRLEALSLTQRFTDGPGGRPLNNYVHLLVQALQSRDAFLLNNILSKGEDEEVIGNTVRRLPISHVVPFLQFLQDVILDKGVKNLTCINWIKSVLYHHMSHLSSVPNKKELLEPFYVIFSAKTSSFLAVSKLNARINLLLTHVKNRHENSTQTNTESYAEAAINYKDASSDDDDLMMDVDGGPSESSEDIWDDWTEEEDEGSPATEDEKGPTSKGKRKAAEDEDYISLESEDEMEDEEDDEEPKEDEDENEEEMESDSSD